MPPSNPEADADAIDQFELVLHTLGLEPDGAEAPSGSPAEAVPTHMVENIVLEGDEITQSEAVVPDKPLDELDLFTRRLSMATGDTDPTFTASTPGISPPPPRPATTASSGGPGASSAPPAARLAARRVRVARDSAGREVDAIPASGAATAAARAAGRDTGASAPRELESGDAMGLSSLDAATPDLDIPALRASTPGQQRFWIVGVGLLALLLLLQVVNHWRDALAASPTWGRPVIGLYSSLGMPLQPSWDLSAYEVRQQGAQSESGPHQAIRVRFSLANHATRAQPVPLLRLTLLDRYGRRVAERDLTPADYWPRGRSPQSFLGADERVDTEIQVRDPSADSASFELDVCLRAAQGAIRCAGDTAGVGAPAPAA